MNWFAACIFITIVSMAACFFDMVSRTIVVVGHDKPPTIWTFIYRGSFVVFGALSALLGVPNA